MHVRERYFIQTQGPNDTAFNALYEKALEITNRLGTVERIVFVSHTLNNDGWLERRFGRDAVRKLKKGIEIEGADITLKFESLNNYDPVGNEILLTMGLRSDEILLLDDDPDIAAVLALPWTPNDVEKWSRICGAINIQTGLTAEPYNEPSCVVKKALQDLSEDINMATGLSHSDDEDEAKTYLRALQKYHYSLPETEIESYLIKELNWPKENANQILTIINRINTGRSFQGGQKTNLKQYINRWQRDCEE